MQESNSKEWYNPWLVSVLLLFFWGTVTGYYLFFLAPFIGNDANLAEFTHTVLGLVLIPVYVIFQIQHYLKKRKFSGTLTYKLGLATCFSTLLLIITGIIIIPELHLINTNYINLAELIHSIASFIWIILITTHLVLVVKL